MYRKPPLYPAILALLIVFALVIKGLLLCMGSPAYLALSDQCFLQAPPPKPCSATTSRIAGKVDVTRFFSHGREGGVKKGIDRHWLTCPRIVGPSNTYLVTLILWM